MAARIDHGPAQLLTRTGLDWSDKYPSVIAALANVKAKTAYLDGELCGVDDAGLLAEEVMSRSRQSGIEQCRQPRVGDCGLNVSHLDRFLLEPSVR
jgi:ATP-dependent DNA ligase